MPQGDDRVAICPLSLSARERDPVEPAWKRRHAVLALLAARPIAWRSATILVRYCTVSRTFLCQRQRFAQDCRQHRKTAQAHGILSHEIECTLAGSSERR